MYASSFPSPEARATQDAAAWAQHEDRLKKQQAVAAQRHRGPDRVPQAQPRIDMSQWITRLGRDLRIEDLPEGVRQRFEEDYARFGPSKFGPGMGDPEQLRPWAEAWEALTANAPHKQNAHALARINNARPQPVNVENWAAGADANQLPEEMRQFFMDELTNARATQNWDKVGSWMQGWKAATGQEPIRQQDRAQDRAAEVVMSQLGQPPKTGPYGMPDMEGSVLTGHSMGGGGAYFNVPKSAFELQKKRAEMEWLEMEMKKREMMRRMRDMDGDGVRQMLY